MALTTVLRTNVLHCDKSVADTSCGEPLVYFVRRSSVEHHLYFGQPRKLITNSTAILITNSSQKSEYQIVLPVS